MLETWGGHVLRAEMKSKESQMKVVSNTARAYSILGLLFAAVLAGCTRQVPSDGDKAVVKRFNNLRGMRYCEVFLIGGTIFPKNLQAAFYNTTDLNNVANPRDTCPAEIWNKVDAEGLKKQYDVWGVFKNGPRGWAMDWIELAAGPSGPLMACKRNGWGRYSCRKMSNWARKVDRLQANRCPQKIGDDVRKRQASLHLG